MIDWVKRLFAADGSSEAGSLREAKKAIEKILAFLSDDDLQNRQLPELMRPLLRVVPTSEMIPGGRGDFGRSMTNPVPVNGPLGEALYLTKLISDEGQQSFAHRLGSVDSVDAYEVVTFDGKRWDIIWMSPYWTRKSALAPSGFRGTTRAGQQLLLSATNTFVDDFPRGIGPALLEFSQAWVGFPIVPMTRVSQIMAGTDYRRPDSHTQQLRGLRFSAFTRGS